MPTELVETPKLRERILAADLVVVGTVAALVRVEKLEGFEAPRLAGFFEFQVERALLGEPPAERVLVRVFGDGTEGDPEWTSDLRPETRRLLLLCRDADPEQREEFFAPYFSSAFDIDDANRVRFPADVVDGESRRVLRPTKNRAQLDRVKALVDGLARERTKRERELAELVPRRRARRYPEVEEMPERLPISEGPAGPPGPGLEAETPGGRPAEPERE